MPRAFNLPYMVGELMKNAHNKIKIGLSANETYP